MTGQIIAYVTGSFWLCPVCCPGEDEEHRAVTGDHLMPCYMYRCDRCGKLIADRRNDDEE